VSHIWPGFRFHRFGSIPAGADYAHELLANVRAATVVLAIVGPRWLCPDPATNRGALDSPTDWVRRELAAAFEAGVRVVPILTDDATMPAENDLPADIGRFAPVTVGTAAKWVYVTEPPWPWAIVDRLYRTMVAVARPRRRVGAIRSVKPDLAHGSWPGRVVVGR
jgi:hypothetical protein